MSYRLYARPLPPFADPEQNPDAQLFDWVLQDASGDTQAHGEASTREHIEQTLAQNALEKVILIGLIPGDETTFCVADIPARQSRFIQQALPFAVEEQVAQDIETVHLALGRHTPDGYQVAAIDNLQMARWQQLCHRGRLEPVPGWRVCDAAEPAWRMVAHAGRQPATVFHDHGDAVGRRGSGGNPGTGVWR